MNRFFYVFKRCHPAGNRTLNDMTDTINRIHIERITHCQLNFVIVGFERKDLIATRQIVRQELQRLIGNAHIGEIHHLHIKLCCKHFSDLQLRHSVLGDQQLQRIRIWITFAILLRDLNTGGFDCSGIDDPFIN